MPPKRRAACADDVIATALSRGLPDRSTIDCKPVWRKLRPRSQKPCQRDLALWKAYAKKYPKPSGVGFGGYLDERNGWATTRTIRIKMRRFCSAWERENNQVIPEEVKYSLAPTAALGQDAKEMRRQQLYGARRALGQQQLMANQRAHLDVYPKRASEHEQRDWCKDHFSPRRAAKPGWCGRLEAPGGSSTERLPRGVLEGPSAYLWSLPGAGTVVRQGHGDRHIDRAEVPFRCGPVVFRTATACAGYCPSCLGNETLPAASRLRSYTNRQAWLRHVDVCLPRYLEVCRYRATINGAIPCPHYWCPGMFEDDPALRLHLQDAVTQAVTSAAQLLKACPPP
ncbi:carbonic anhydrase 2 [Niveomyces insectorum RCEF 264]|uniref:Carbonic anhydrase 2 n=1 Tax=Niveomyces insectorum RCEF 264 TaxID=1081102 RepID=A0A167YYH5_9HYPO|nr:carbonic anhydrase 2 [Niveomyces insectorum RCEF 264]